MWTVLLFVIACLNLVLENTAQPSYKGCFSSSFVQKYTSYYQMNQPLNLMESFAACNNRLTKYLGLQADKSTPGYNFVFCGNDLFDVSLKVKDSWCHPCQENNGVLCGNDGTMSVYFLRESTPLALLLATDSGVELLINNNSTLRVAHNKNSEYKFVDYIYTEDTIISVIGTRLLRSFYNPVTMKFSQLYILASKPNTFRGLAVDFTSILVYFGYWGDSDLERYNLTTSQLLVTGSVPQQLSVDPYNRSLTFVHRPYDAIHIFYMDTNTNESHSLHHFHVDKIHALTMDFQERKIYAVLTLKGDETWFLVSLDYGLSEMRVLFSGPQLVNTTAVEVFHGVVVWLTNTSTTSQIYTCKLTPRCSIDTLTIYRSKVKVYDLTIYHPEKQTPGKKLLCANLTCQHGCEAFSPFSARCVCPEGMKLGSDNSTCYAPSSTPSPPTSGTNSSNSKRSKMVTSKTNKGDNTGISLYDAFILLCALVIMYVFVGIGVFMYDLYRHKVTVMSIVEEGIEFATISNEYTELPSCNRN